MNNIQIFKYENNDVRTVEMNGEPWFVGKDVASVLGYKDTVNALKTHVDEDEKTGWQITTQFGVKETTIINESGLYSLILSSKLPTAKQFKR
jgi:prophage antirepressor-like protein